VADYDPAPNTASAKAALAPDNDQHDITDLGTPTHTQRELITQWDEVLPKELIDGMQYGLREDSRYWTENDYPPKTGFQSHFFDWSKNATNLMEQAMLHYSHQLPERIRKTIVGTEWWAHKRPSTLDEGWMGHQLHFDHDESDFEKREEMQRAGDNSLLHPEVSSIFFVTGEWGGPTLVLNQTVGPRPAVNGWNTKPMPNRLILFRGDLLHGVFPSLRDERIRQEHKYRVTLLAGFATRACTYHSETAEQLGSCSRMPVKGSTTRFTWPWTEFPINPNFPIHRDQIPAYRPKKQVDPPAISPIWEQI